MLRNSRVRNAFAKRQEAAASELDAQERRNMDKSLESYYNLKKGEVELRRVQTRTGKMLEVFPNPTKSIYGVRFEFPEYTSLCPKTSQPDFATISILYEPLEHCIEMKSCKYYLNSFRNEGHFYEEAINLIFSELYEALKPRRMCVVGNFNARGGMPAAIFAGDVSLLNEYPGVDL